VMIDLDGFKQVNDRHGHAVGDLVLRNVGKLVRESVRVNDIAGRYGGEELCVVLPATGLEGACVFAEALRLKIAALDHQTAGLGAVTASLGVAVIDQHGGSCTTLLKQADDALYRAKHGGRNRVEC
jgi:diguanylate cyclase (GGDEF)-like protein